MLLNLKEYHRPAPEANPERSFDRVLALLARSEVRTVLLAGGDALLAAEDDSVEAVVDLQALGLNYLIAVAPDGIFRIGAMSTRAKLAEDDTAQHFSSGVIAEGARRWGGNVQRNRATVGGAVAVTHPNDPLILALLACDAAVKLYTPTGYRTLDLGDFLTERSSRAITPYLIVELSVPITKSSQRGALSLVARTPSDAPIVAACAVVDVVDGRCDFARLALGGVADAPVTAGAAMQTLSGQRLTREAIADAAALAARDVNPPGDYRGSSGYRRAMAEVVSARALLQAAGQAA